MNVGGLSGSRVQRDCGDREGILRAFFFKKKKRGGGDGAAVGSGGVGKNQGITRERERGQKLKKF